MDTLGKIICAALVTSCVGFALVRLGDVDDRGGPGPVPPPVSSHRDMLGQNGLPSTVACAETPDGKGGIDIRFSGARIPAPLSDNGTTETVAGVLHDDGSVIGTVSSSDIGGGLSIRAATDNELRRLGVACRQALSAVPGIAG